MPESKIQPHKITKPIQILAVWFVGLLALVGILLAGAANIEHPPWIPALLAIAAIFIIPLFIFLIFLLQTRYRTQFLDDAHYADWLKRKEEAFDKIENQLNKSTEALVTSSAEAIENIEKKHLKIEEFTDKLLHIDKAGLIAIFPHAKDAGEHIVNAIISEEKEIFIVGTTLRGLIWPGHGEERIIKALSDRINTSDCKLQFLLTHPAFVHLNQSLECIQRKEAFHVVQELLSTVKILQMHGISHEDIRFVKGTPTMFGIMTSKSMILNPFPYEVQSYYATTFIFDSKNGENEIYKEFERSHFRGVWAGRNVEPLEGYDLGSIKKIFETTLEDLGLDKSRYQTNFEDYMKS